MEKKSFNGQIINHAMSYGTLMGGFWIAKFMLVPFMFSTPMASLMFLLLTATVPFVGYALTRYYRNRYCEDERISFLQALSFCMLMYLFASLLVSLAHYIFFRYIDQGALLATYSQMMEAVLQANPALSATMGQYQEAMALISSLSPIELTIQLISNNLFYGILFSLPTALFASLHRKREKPTQP